MKRTLSSALSALLIVSTPGMAPYQALAQNFARPVGRPALMPALAVPGAPASFAPSALRAEDLSIIAPSLSVIAAPSIVAAAPAALALAAVPAAAPVPARSAVGALRGLSATPKLAENAAALGNFYDLGAAREGSAYALDTSVSAAAKDSGSGLIPWLPAARPTTAVIGAARTPKGYARAAARRLADGWPYFAIGAAAVLAHHLFGPEAAFAVLMAAGPCAAFRAMQDGEAMRLGINDESRRRAAMEEMQQILRQFGRDAAKEGEGDPDVQSRVDAEIMTRSALQGVTHALEHFLKILRAEELELPAAKARLDALVRSAVVGALKANGMPGDDESMISKILDKTGLTTKVMEWESRHMVVESMLAAVREEKKKNQASAPGASASAPKTKDGQAAGKKLLSLILLIAGGSLLAAAGHGWALPVIMIGPLAVGNAPPKAPELPPLPDTPMVHHLQLAGYEREEIEFFLGATRDVAEAPASPVEGRHEEMRRAVDTLSRPAGRPRSLLLVGPEGVGKRALVETLAREIAEKRYKGLEDARVLEFDASSAVGGNIEGLALQLRALVAKGRGKVLLYIDGPGNLKNQSLNEHNFFKIMAPYMARGEITLIVTADEAESRLLTDKGPFPFETVNLPAPSPDKAAPMLEAHAPALAGRYALAPVPGLFESAARLAARYLAKIALPGAGLDLLERAYSARSKQARVNRAEAEVRRRLERVIRNLRRLKEGRDEAEIATRRRNAVSDDLDALHELRGVIADVAAEPANEGLVRESDLAEEASRLSGIPASKMLQDEREKLLNLESWLKSRVIHQDEAVTAVAEAVRRARAGLKDPNKPIGSFLFLGPTGVGKTELTKALAEILFDSEGNMIRLDMSEYMEPHTVARMIGSPPGYVGFDAGGQLTEAVRDKPYSVVLLDEVEKAHPDVLNVLLQAMDDGRLTDGKGRTVPFGNVIFVLTSNLGSAHIMRLMQERADRAKIKDDVMGAVREHFRPEFINRLDEIVIFNPLGREQAAPIVGIHLDSKVRRWLADQGIELERASAAALERLADLGFDPLYGGRPLARAVQKYVLNPLSELLLSLTSDDDERVRRRRKAVLDVVDGVIVPRLEDLPFEAVAERKPAHPAASALWLSLLDLPEASLGAEAVESFLFGPPEKDLPSEAHGAFKPMGVLKGGAALETIAAATDDPNLKDPELDRATKAWTAAAALTGDAAEAFRRWMSKVARCAKSTNNLRPAPHALVSYSLHEGAGFREYRVKGLPLTRAELILNARIFENHYAKDSSGEDQSWELADALLTQGEYGRAELFEIKRLIGAIPGAEFGYHSDREALTFWLRLPAAVAIPAVEAAVETTAAPIAAGIPGAILYDKALDDLTVVITFDDGIDAVDRTGEIDMIVGERNNASGRTIRVVAASPGRAAAIAEIWAAKDAVTVTLSEDHRSDAADAARRADEDSDADAAGHYRFLTQGAPAHMKELHGIVAGLLSASDQIAVFWGFRFARAALGEQGFEPMRRFLPPLTYLNTDARGAYLAEQTLRSYYAAADVDPGSQALVTRALARHASEATAAARSLALGSALKPELSKALVDGIITPYKTFTRNHYLHAAARYLTWPLWIGGLASAPLFMGEFDLTAGLSPWLRYGAGLALLAVIVTATIAWFSDSWVYKAADGAYDDARPKFDIARIVAPVLRPGDRARLVRHFEKVVRGRWAANKREQYESGRIDLRDAHWAAAQALEELRAELTPARARSLAASVMAHAEKPSRKSSISDTLAPLMMLELLDDAQKSRALALAFESVDYGVSTATMRFLRLAREGHLPAERTDEVIQALVRTLAARTADTPTIAAMSETLAALAAGRPENMRLATFEAAFGARAQFGQGETGEKPVAYFTALRTLAPNRKALERVADHLLTSTRIKVDQLAWLIAQPGLDAGRRAKVLDQLLAAGEGDPAQDATWAALPIVARLTEVPRERRVMMVTGALDRMSRAPRSGNEFSHYARAVEAVRLLAELDAAP